ncbi:transposon ty3-g Gag-Pol polyprotein [Plakobranchus ocellatus]|uniref:Transposon ty3-g Gag-Pol polyprotein n=1 Tax=Plakobranchus ocellatus TaxID=259542 RepID=A0AAV4B9J3_9GAST|nr:transposon ty3-g Gag-Pol polyprotein [Plakobranchus ocellatus]
MSLEMIHFYHRFKPKDTVVLQPLMGALKKHNLPQLLPWTKDMDDAFKSIKEALVTATTLSLPAHDVPIFCPAMLLIM